MSNSNAPKEEQAKPGAEVPSAPEAQPQPNAADGPFSAALLARTRLPRQATSVDGSAAGTSFREPQHTDSLGCELNYGGDHLSPYSRLKARHYEVARLLFLGKSHREISERVHLEPQTISRLAGDPKIREEVERMRDLAFERTVGERLKDIGPESMDVIEDTIFGRVVVKAEKRIELAQWVVEKLDGKAGQKIDVSSSTLDKFMSALSEMQASGETLDVTPAALPTAEGEARSAELEAEPSQSETPDWRAWLAENS